MLDKLRFGGETQPVILDTERMHVALSTTGDASALSLYYIRNREFLAPWEPKRQENFFSMSGWQQRMIQLVELQRNELAFYFVIRRKEAKEIIGVITYSNVLRHPMHSCYVGYSMDQDCQGQGLMSEALAATNQWMFEQQNLHRIMAGYMPRNHGSAKVLAKQGFVIEGEAKDYLLINGKWEDHILTALTNQDWNKKND
ncbi:ribosomal protein S5-alanine N-acetyltransferase [Thaumasiovibrio subtropicus]|uniref:ribosomal protein S5-alanine N-acetyltransferase n=1 Tax=Thaumasiovibrio subtropicus TaxID=1891207 RepID=UPI000B350225|nr:ribosomal protein S5-alanine N-acetyltransferase [Thaumasiovibrio subtropicus]